MDEKQKIAKRLYDYLDPWQTEFSPFDIFYKELSADPFVAIGYLLDEIEDLRDDIKEAGK